MPITDNVTNSHLLPHAIVPWGITCCKGEDSLWRGGLEPDTLRELLASCSLQVLEEVGPKEHQERYLGPKGRHLRAMEIERLVLAEVGERP